jgi:hypothetical protein
VKFKKDLFKKFDPPAAREHKKASEQMTSTQLEIDARASTMQSRSRYRSATSLSSSFYREQMTPEEKARAALKNGLTYYEACEIENVFKAQKPQTRSAIRQKDE